MLLLGCFKARVRVDKETIHDLPHALYTIRVLCMKLCTFTV